MKTTQSLQELLDAAFKTVEQTINGEIDIKTSRARVKQQKAALKAMKVTEKLQKLRK
jgi:hypothetical protein